MGMDQMTVAVPVRAVSASISFIAVVRESRIGRHVHCRGSRRQPQQLRHQQVRAHSSNEVLATNGSQESGLSTMANICPSQCQAENYVDFGPPAHARHV